METLDNLCETIEEKTALLYSKINLHYMLRILVAENHVDRSSFMAYMTHLKKSQQKFNLLSAEAKYKHYRDLFKSHEEKIEPVNKLLTYFPQMLFLEESDIQYLLSDFSYKSEK